MNVHKNFTDQSNEVDFLKCEWLHEIYLKRKDMLDGINNSSPDRLDLARRLYQSGLTAECNGELQIAVEQYRRATLLVPDIERQIKPYLQIVDTDQSRKECRSIKDQPDVMYIASEKIGEVEQQSLILTLPDELLFHIMRWIVGSDLDLYSLLVLNKVCHKFLSVSRDEQLWRLVCQRLWPFCELSGAYGGTWRSMAIMRPHLLYHGCYIGSVTYVRHGEPTTNIFNGPLLIVRYFRVLRFKSDGSVTMITSALEPQDIIKQLAMLDEHDISSLWPQLSQSSVSMGSYSLDGSTIWLQLTRVSDSSRHSVGLKCHKKYRSEEPSAHLMNISLHIKPSVNRPNQVLHWHSFSLTVVRKNEALLTTFDTSTDKYPRLVFSRVKAFCSRLSSQPI